jgi:hypothetical protein
MTRCTCVQAVREACAPLYATIVGLRAEIAELRDHLSQANDTISRLTRCQTAADLQRMRETDRWGALTEARSATERPPTAPSADAPRTGAFYTDNTGRRVAIAAEFKPPMARGCGEAWAWHAPDAGDVDA